MNTPGIVVSALLAGLVAIGLSACAEEISPGITPRAPSSPPASSISSGEDELEREALEVLRAYDRAYLVVTSDPSIDVSTVAPYVTSEQLESDRSAIAKLKSEGRSFVGEISYVSSDVVQTYDQGGLQILVCQDVSGLRVIDAVGADVTPSSRPNVVAMTVSFARGPAGLLVSDYEGWEGADPCAAH